MRYTKHIVLLFLSLILFLPTSSQSLWYRGRQDYSKVWSKIKSRQSVKILHIGDSHVYYGHTSRPIEQALQSKYGQKVNFNYKGINGSTYALWTNEDNIRVIQEQSPDLLIVSLGTNDSYTHSFSPEAFRASMHLFIEKLKQSLPKMKIILTTPPASYFRNNRSQIVGYKGKGRKRKPIYSSTTNYMFNTNTRSAVNTINYIGRAEGLFVVDLNKTIGTKPQSEEWLKKSWMHTDRVHYTEQGYEKQGQTIAKALIEIIESK